VTFDAPSAQVAGVARSGRAFRSAAVPEPGLALDRALAHAGRGGEARIEAFDATGRRVRTLLPERVRRRHGGHWDLADDGGARLPAGLYLFRAAASGAVSTRRVLVLP
jgi:hypothetical protein